MQANRRRWHQRSNSRDQTVLAEELHLLYEGSCRVRCCVQGGGWLLMHAACHCQVVIRLLQRPNCISCCTHLAASRDIDCTVFHAVSRQDSR